MLAWYAATSEVPWLFLFATWILALTVAAAGYAYWNARGLRLHLVALSVEPARGSPVEDLPEQVLRLAPPATVFEGDALTLEAGLDTTGHPRGPAALSGAVGETHIAGSTGLVPRSGWRVTARVDGVRRGSLGASGWRIEAGDFLGFFRGGAVCADAEIAPVFPRFTSLDEPREARDVEAGVAAPRPAAGAELLGVREYRPGDSRRRIHWPSTARRGELIVREYEPPGIQLLTVVVDSAPRSLEIADQIARLAASEAWDCIRAGGRVRLCAAGGEPEPPTRDLWTVLEWLARYPADAPTTGGDLTSGRDETVAITAGDMRTLEAAQRAWVVGDAEVDADVPLRRVGTSWPL